MRSAVLFESGLFRLSLPSHRVCIETRTVPLLEHSITASDAPTSPLRSHLAWVLTMTTELALKARIALLERAIGTHKARLLEAYEIQKQTPSATSTRFSWTSWREIRREARLNRPRMQNSRKRTSSTFNNLCESGATDGDETSSKRLRIRDVPATLPASTSAPPGRRPLSLRNCGSVFCTAKGCDDIAYMTIPKETIRHLTTYLATKSKPCISDRVLQLVFAYMEDIQGHHIRSRIVFPDPTMAEAAREKNAERNGLHALPDELVLEIKELLADPADVVCLSLTCKKLFLKLDYQLIDIANIDLRTGLAHVLEEHGLNGVLSPKRAEISERLDKDIWSELVRSEAESLAQKIDEQDMKGCRWLCGTCWELHPGSYFSAEQICVSASSRVCNAATAKLRICDHWTEDYMSLRALRPAKRGDRKACEPKQLECSRSFAHTAGTNGNAAPSLRIDNEDGIEITRTYGLLRGQTYTAFAVEDVGAALQARANIPLCQHLCLGDPMVVETYRHERQIHGLRSGGAACAVCGAVWYFLRSETAIGRAPAYAVDTLALVVTRYVDFGWRIWSNEYLHLVEDGDHLMDVRNAASVAKDG